MTSLVASGKTGWAVPLYRRILRLHRRLPPAIRSLGDDYVRSEFRRHRSITDDRYLLPFFAEWTRYADLLNAQQQQQRPTAAPDTSNNPPPEPVFGHQLTIQDLNRFNDEQIGQLYELRKETRKK